MQPAMPEPQKPGQLTAREYLQRAIASGNPKEVEKATSLLRQEAELTRSGGGETSAQLVVDEQGNPTGEIRVGPAPKKHALKITPNT